MARLLLSKSTLLKEKKRLESFQRFLPSLEMKRQQLMAALKDNRKALKKLQQQQQELEDFIAEQVPMLANQDIDLQCLCEVKHFTEKKVNVVGVWLLDVDVLEFELAQISVLAKPHWVDVVQLKLQQGLELAIRFDIETFNNQLLEAELKKVTQRVNLFDKVLIPETKANLRKIQLYLDDKDREMVVTSKLAKNKRQQAYKQQQLTTQQATVKGANA